MSASMKHVRVKLIVNKSSHNATKALLHQQMWYSINFEKCETVQAVISDLCGRFGGDTQSSSLNLEKAVIPEWEICSQIFRDNDELE